MDLNIIYGLDVENKDIFVIEKYNKYKFFYEEPTEDELQYIFIEFDCNKKEKEYMLNRLNEWKILRKI